MSKPKVPKAPPAAAPIAVPEVADTQAGDEAVKRQRKKSGFQNTMLTGALAPSSGGRTTLG